MPKQGEFDMAEQQKFDFSIVSANLTIEAMRDSGYKDTDHALAELIDNSVEAHASSIEVLAIETPPALGRRYARANVTQIAVADDGDGMDRITLRRALRFGDGTRLDRQMRGIGRFGIGLPQSSISQCRRVDVWTWQNGPDNALHCYLDLDEIKNTGRSDVPEPSHKPVPQQWKSIASNTIENSGTLVVWNNLDRTRWKGGRKTLDRTAELCGRIYRKFLTDRDNKVTINLFLVLKEDEKFRTIEEIPCKPNDPLYLMAESSTPDPFHDRPMFEEFNSQTWEVRTGDTKGNIEVICSKVCLDAINQTESSVSWPRAFRNPGDAPWGKHAARNLGVSIVRAKRELDMSHAWVNNYDPTERWWSVEVNFDPVLDEIFGVVNNKQHAHAFVEGAWFDWEVHSDESESYGEFIKRLEETGDLRRHLIEVWNWIDKQIIAMRKEWKIIRKGVRTGPRHQQTGEEVEDVATRVIRQQAADGIMGDSDNAPATSDEEKREKIVASARQKNVDVQTARRWAEETIGGDRRVLIKSADLDDPFAFFNVEWANEIIEIWLNSNHPVHQHLIETLSVDSEETAQEELTEKLGKAAFALQMMLIAWGRYEDKTPEKLRRKVKMMRSDWGREIQEFLDPIE